MRYYVHQYGTTWSMTRAQMIAFIRACLAGPTDIPGKILKNGETWTYHDGSRTIPQRFAKNFGLRMPCDMQDDQFRALLKLLEDGKEMEDPLGPWYSPGDLFD